MSSKFHGSNASKALSMHLTNLLRHNRQFFEQHLRLTGHENEEQRQMKLNGFVAIDAIIIWSNQPIRKEDIERLIDCQVFVNAHGAAIGKVRMEMNQDKTHVRALNGHSNGIRLIYPEVPVPLHAFHLTNEEAAVKIIDEKQGLKRMGRDHIHMHKILNPSTLNPNDRKRTVILQINFPEGHTCVEPNLNNYIFSTVPIPYEYIERKGTVREFMKNGGKFDEK